MASRGLGPPPGRRPEERRIDPEDGQPRTFEELRAICRGRYSDQEIQDYWNIMMVPQSGEAIHNVANDPFLTHPSRTQGDGVAGPPQALGSRSSAAAAPGRGRPPPGSPPLPSESPDGSGGPRLADVRIDPFLTMHRGTDVANVREDPFLTHEQRMSPEARRTYDYDERLQSRRQKIAEAARAAKVRGEDWVLHTLGPGDPYRELEVRAVFVFGPWMLFLWVVLLWCFLRHFSMAATVALVTVLFVCFLGMTFVWYLGRRAGPISLLSLGALCVLATAAGTWAGGYGWDHHYRQYWWTKTGFQDGLATGSTPAGARSDFAIVNFEQGPAPNVSRVEHSMAGGYKDGDFYCVAPILSADGAESSPVVVNYWAVGINCCQLYGSFTCDASREWKASTGVVMLEGGFPCPTCNNERFRAAVAKAEAVHGLKSAEAAVFVRWVQDAGSVTRGMLIRCVAFVLVCAALGGPVFGALGWAAWYYGWGVEPPSDGPAPAGGSIPLGGVADASDLSAKELARRKQRD